MKARIILLSLAAGLIVAGVWFFGQQKSTRAPVNQPISTAATAVGRQPSQSAPAVVIAAPPIQVEGLTPSVRQVIEEQPDYPARLSAARQMPPELPASDLEAIYAFLRRRGALDGEQRGHVLKNELLNALCAMNPPPRGLCQLIVDMYRDAAQDIVLRDYAIQHLPMLYRQLEKSGSLDPQQRLTEQTLAVDVLWEALSQIDSSIAGTALLGLLHLSEGREEIFSRERIGRAAVRLAGSADTGELSRITAMQVSGQMGLSEVLPVLMQNAREGAGLTLRISAIGALGALGMPEAAPVLTDLLNGAEERLRLPAREALRQIDLKTRRAQNNLK